MKKALGTWIILFCTFYFIGHYARYQRAFSYLHEYGHVLAARQVGIEPTSITRYLTMFSQSSLPYSVWVGGFWLEMIVWSGLGIGLSFAKWDGVGGMFAGFCFGFQNRIYMMAQIPTNVDFNQAGKFALVQWRFWGPLIMIGMFLILGRRLWKWWQEARLDGGDHHSKIAEHKDSEQGTSADLRKADSGLDL